MASPVDTSVKHYNEGMPGAPTLNGVADALIGVLDACLVTGFGLRTATSVVVASGVATVTLSSNAKNPALIDSVILVDGVTGGTTDLNGEQRVTGDTTTTLTFATAVADGTASGTITIKTAPAGWEKAYTAANVACYRSLSPASFKPYLRVLDSATTSADVRMFETMSDANTGTNQAPTTASAANVLWVKSSLANATANPWDVFADARMVYFCPTPGVASNANNVVSAVFPFGDIAPYKSIDPYAVWLSGTNAIGAPSGSALLGQQGGVSAGPSRLLRSYTGLGVAQQAYALAASGASTGLSGSDAQWGTFPSADGKVRTTQVHVTEGAATGSACIPRGMMPGLHYVPSTGGNISFPRGAKHQQNGRLLQAVKLGAVFNTAESASNGFGFVDITGPWRSE